MATEDERCELLIPIDALGDHKLSLEALRTLMLIIKLSEENGWYTQGLAKLADEVGTYEYKVFKHILELEQRGYLKVYREYNPETGKQEIINLQVI